MDAEPKHREAEMVLSLPEMLTIAGAGALRASLLEALDAHEHVVLDASAVAAVDAAGLQLLCAARRSALARDRKLTVSGASRSKVLPQALAASGLSRAPDGAWLEEEANDG